MRDAVVCGDIVGAYIRFGHYNRVIINGFSEVFLIVAVVAYKIAAYYVTVCAAAEIKVSAVVTEAYIVDVFEVFPGPVEGGELTVGVIFLGNIVSGVVALKSEVEIGMQGFADLNRHVDVILQDVWVGFVTGYENFYLGEFILFHSDYLKICKTLPTIGAMS